MSNPNTDFKIACSVNKAYEYHDLTTRQAKKRIQGMASGTAVDREGERMSRSVIESFQRTIKEGIILDSGEWSYVPLVNEHRKNGLGEPQWDQILGHLVDAWVDEEWNLWIEAELDPVNPAANMLYEKLTRDPEEGKPKTLGLSIGGIVIDAAMEWDEELQRSINTYLAVALRECTVTSAPAFPTRYMAALYKSVNWEKVQRNEESVPMQINNNENTEVVKTDESLAADVQVEGVIEAESVADDQLVEDANEEVEVAADQDAVDVQDAGEEQVEAEADAVEKSEEQVAADAVQEAAYVTTDAFEALTSTVGDLAGKLATIAEQFEKSISQGLLFKPEFDAEGDAVETDAQVEAEAEAEAEVEAEKPEVIEEQEAVEEQEEVVGPVVDSVGGSAEVVEAEKSETAPVERSVDMNALLDMFAQLNDKISSLDKSFSAKIEQISHEEVDKSIVPSRANESTNKLFDDNSDSEFLEVIKSKRAFAAIDAAFE